MTQDELMTKYDEEWCAAMYQITRNAQELGPHDTAIAICDALSNMSCEEGAEFLSTIILNVPAETVNITVKRLNEERKLQLN